MLKKTLLPIVGMGCLVASCVHTDVPGSESVKTPTTTASQALTADPPRRGGASASGIKRDHMKPAVKPQDDFFLFVNGTWLDRTPIPADESSYGVFTILRERARENLRTIVSELERAPDLAPGSDSQKIRDFYQSFMETAAINKLGVAPLQAEWARINAIASREELASYFGRSLQVGGAAPFGFHSGIDYKDPTRYVAFLYQQGLGLPDREQYLNKDKAAAELRHTYTNHITTMLRLAKLDRPDEAARAILKLETALAKRQASRTELRDRLKTYNPMERSALKTLAPNFPWERFLAATLDSQPASKAGTNTSSTTAKLPASTKVIVSSPAYLKQFSEVLASTSLQEWKWYLQWHLLSNYADYLSDDLAKESFAFNGTTLRGAKVQEERWERGIDLVNGTLGELLGKEYVKRHFQPEAKMRVQAMVENLRAAYKQSILDLPWMSDTTKQRAIEKLSLFRPKIGYPNKWQDYSELEVKPHDLVGNIMRLQMFEYQDNIAKLSEPVDREEWFMTPQTVNAYYDGTRNEIVFPAAILQPPFFSLTADDAVNYGSIGAVIGHEMGHGFDDQGSRFNGKGEMTNWWTAADLKEFGARTKRLVEQYSRFEPLPGQRVNGAYTLGENIGDLGGLTIAYKAYQLSLRGKPAPMLDGFTGRQRFFIGYGQVWAWKYTEEELKHRLLTDPHAPSQYRVNGVVRNMPEFYDAFDVEKGQGMFLPPEERVKIW